MLAGHLLGLTDKVDQTFLRDCPYLLQKNQIFPYLRRFWFEIIDHY